MAVAAKIRRGNLHVFTLKTYQNRFFCSLPKIASGRKCRMLLLLLCAAFFALVSVGEYAYLMTRGKVLFEQL